jgi:hypothetical protein
MKGKGLIKIYAGEMNAEQYFNHLTAEFPDIKDKINDWDSDMIFFKMEVFAEYTIDKIKSENKEE